MSYVFKLRKLLGTDRKHWPVTVEKYEIFEDSIREKKDRGRRIKDGQEDEYVYEFLKEEDSTVTIPQKYVKRDRNGNPKLEIAKVQGSDGPMFAPIEKDVDVVPGDLEHKEDLPNEIGMNFIMKISRFIKIGEKQLERHYEITKDENSAWYQAPIVWMVGGLIGFGLFIVFAGIAQQNVIEASQEAASSLIPLIAARKLKQ